MTIRVEGLVDTAAEVGNAGEARHLRLLLKPWRRDGGELVRKLLYVDFPEVVGAAARRATPKWPRGTTVALAVSALREPGKNAAGWMAEGEGPIRKVAGDVVLDEAAALEKKPGFVDDAILGRLALNRAMSWFEGMRKFRRSHYEVMVVVADVDDTKAVAKAVAKAGVRVRRIDDDLTKLRDAIADALLERCNTTWRLDQRAVTRAAFKKQLLLSSIIIASDTTTVYLAAGDLFGDHGVEVRISPRGKTNEILIS